jgi:hypothetical protein
MVPHTVNGFAVTAVLTGVPGVVVYNADIEYWAGKLWQ